MWASSEYIVFDDEDESEIKSRFVELSIMHDKASPLQICEYLFKNRREPFRFHQFAVSFSTDLEIAERIRLGRLNGGREPGGLDTKEQRLRKLQAIYDDQDVPAKDRIAAMRAAAEIAGEIQKPLDAPKANDRRKPPTVVYARYAD